MSRFLLVLGAAAALAAPASAATRYAFGREGGNIRPFKVTIAATGAVQVNGPVKVGQTKLTAAQLAALAKTAAPVKLTSQPALTLCPGTLPDTSATYITAGSRTVAVRGGCSARFTQVWNALAAAVRLSYG